MAGAAQNVSTLFIEITANTCMLLDYIAWQFASFAFLRFLFYTGLEIRAGQWTLSSQNWLLTGQNL
jgi:hypothetical protein